MKKSNRFQAWRPPVIQRSDFMGIGLKPDKSYLFSNFNNKSSSSIFDMSFLSDYNSIMSRSYGKLVKAYYKKLESDDVSKEDKKDKTSNKDKLSTSLAEDSSKSLVAVQDSTSALSELAGKFVKEDADKLLVQKETKVENEDGTMEVKKEYDMDAINKSISGFVDKYNDVIKNSSESESSGIKKAAGNMTNITDLYANSLKKLGITINGDKTLSIDEKTFKASEVSDIEDTFVGSSSFSKSVSSQASFINDAATREATKANTYTSSGSYSNNFSTGDIFTSLF